MDSLVNVFKLTTSSVVLIGDINIDIKTDNIDNHSDEYLTCAASYGLLPAHQFPTRLTNCLDHIILKSNKSAMTFVIVSSITDYEPLLFFLQDLRANLYVTRTRSKIN